MHTACFWPVRFAMLLGLLVWGRTGNCAVHAACAALQQPAAGVKPHSKIGAISSAVKAHVRAMITAHA